MPVTKPKEPFIRDCDDYQQEYKACKSVSNMLHAYYAYGHWPKKGECGSWKEMYNLCLKCKQGDEEAKGTLVGMEKALSDDIIRKRANVWTYRDEPPLMWHFPGKTRTQDKTEMN